MFARRVYMHLKPNSVAEFTERLEKDVLPLLRKQKGFQDEITFVGQRGAEAFAISLWDKAENAEAYNRGTYPQVTKILATVVEGAPQVETYDVANSTFHKMAAAVAVCTRQIIVCRGAESAPQVVRQKENSRERGRKIR